jgi:hypothetical protein
MNKIKILLFSGLSIVASFIAWFFYFIADYVAKFADAWDKGAEHYEEIERI